MKTIRSLVLVLLAALSAVSSASADAVLIRSGDTLSIRTISPSGFHETQVYRVDGLGFITHTLAGRIRIWDLTTGQAEDLLERVIQDKGHLNSAVKVAFVGPLGGGREDRRDGTFTISGAVQKPGAYPAGQGMTLAGALKLGGLRPGESPELVRIKRKGSTMKHLKPSEKGTYRIQAGDEIIVLK